MTYKTVIKTNHHERLFSYAYEVPESVLKSDFDYLEDGEGTFFKYKGWWYSLDQFTATSGPDDEWDGYHADSYFSGVCIKVSDDCETYKVGTYFSVSV